MMDNVETYNGQPYNWTGLKACSVAHRKVSYLLECRLLVHLHD